MQFLQLKCELQNLFGILLTYFIQSVIFRMGTVVAKIPYLSRNFSKIRMQFPCCFKVVNLLVEFFALVSTEIYAKIDLGALQEVVRPWPARGGAR